MKTKYVLLDKKIVYSIICILFVIFLSSIALASIKVTLSDQGTGAKTISTGLLIDTGNLTVKIYDAMSGGTLIYSETFEDKIVNGSWNIMIGENGSNPLMLNYGDIYYKDYEINGEESFFKNNTGAMTERQKFYAPLGEINTSDLVNQSISKIKLEESINLSNATGYTWQNIKGMPNSNTNIDSVFYNKTESEKRYLNNDSDNGQFTGSFNISTTGNVTSFWGWIRSILKIPFSTNPTVDTTGAIAIDSSSDQLVYYGASKRVITYYEEKCFTLETPVESDDNIPIWSPHKNITITDMYCRCQGGDYINISMSNGTHILDKMECNLTGFEDDGNIGNNSFDPNERLEFDVLGIDGTVEWVNYCFTYTIDSD